MAETAQRILVSIMAKLSLSIHANDALLQYRIVGELSTEISINQKATLTRIGVEISPQTIKDTFYAIQALEEKGYSARAHGVMLEDENKG